MTNQQLSDYIKQQLQQGKDKNQIKKALLNSGWQEADVNQELALADSSQPPKPPTAQAAPKFTPTGLQHLDPKAVWLFFFRWILFFLIIMWFFSGWIMIFLIGSLGSIVSLIIALISAFLWAKLVYQFYRYELTEDGFRKEFGVIAKKYVTIPYERIQNINIERGILDRIIGLSALKIFTAGTGLAGQIGSEGLLPGLSKDTAEELRNQLTHLSRQTKSSGL